MIKEFSSAYEAIKELKLKNLSASASILAVCNGKRNYAFGFVWRYKNDTSPIINYTPNSVCQLDLKGNLISIYKTAIIASQQTGVSTGSISNCCNGKIDNVKGFVFIKYKDFKNL